MNTEGIGSVCVALGAGRMKKEDTIDPSAGIILNRKTGDFVQNGDLLATLYCSDSSLLDQAEDIFLSSLSFSDAQPDRKPLLLRIVE